MQDIIKAKTITKLIEANYYYLKMLDRHNTQSHKQPQQQLPEETPKRAREASASILQPSAKLTHMLQVFPFANDSLASVIPLLFPAFFP